jgi:hypothetical protein
MENINDILKSAKEYILAHEKRNERFLLWTGGVADIVKNILNEIVEKIIIDNDFFKSNLYVTESYATMQSKNTELVSKPMRTIILKSGNILVARFQSETNKSFNSISENGFEIHFNPTLNGKIHVYVYGHNYEDKKAEFKSIEMIDDPKTLDENKIIELVIKGIEFAKTTSYLFIGDNN